MKIVVIGLLLVCITFSAHALETFDAENIETEGNKAVDTGSEVEVETDDHDVKPISRVPCQPCWDNKSNGCRIHEKTINENKEVMTTITCLKDGKQTLEQSSKRPNLFPGLEFERKLFEAHYILNPKTPEPE